LLRFNDETDEEESCPIRVIYVYYPTKDDDQFEKWNNLTLKSRLQRSREESFEGS